MLIETTQVEIIPPKKKIELTVSKTKTSLKNVLPLEIGVNVQSFLNRFCSGGFCFISISEDLITSSL